MTESPAAKSETGAKSGQMPICRIPAPDISDFAKRLK
jgi:hypothetical protein